MARTSLLVWEVHAVEGSGQRWGLSSTSWVLGDQSVASILKSWGEVVGKTFESDLVLHISKGLILAQNERWRRGLGMQVERPARGVAQG